MNWTTRATAVTTGSPEAVWALWVDVSAWPTWDHEIEFARIHGPFEVGTTGVVKARGGPKARFTLTDVHEGYGFSDQTRLPLATVTFHHRMRREDGALLLEHEVTISGRSTFLFKRIVGAKIARGLPAAVTALARQAGPPTPAPQVE
jgi:hypothetical protein